MTKLRDDGPEAVASWTADKGAIRVNCYESVRVIVVLHPHAMVYLS